MDLDTQEGQDPFVELNKAAVDGGYEGVKDPRSQMHPMNAKEHTVGLRQNLLLKLHLRL